MVPHFEGRFIFIRPDQGSGRDLVVSKTQRTRTFGSLCSTHLLEFPKQAEFTQLLLFLISK